MTEPHETRRDRCEPCLGDGFKHPVDPKNPTEQCPTCGGKGWVPAPALASGEGV
jgi:DnaJ-class molecular chaperone